MPTWRGWDSKPRAPLWSSRQGEPFSPHETGRVGHLGQFLNSLQAGVETERKWECGCFYLTRLGGGPHVSSWGTGSHCTTQGRYFKASITIFLRTKIILFYLYINNCFLEPAQRNETQMAIMLKMFTYFLSEDIRLALSVDGMCNLLEDNIVLLILQYIFHIFAATADDYRDIFKQ